MAKCLVVMELLSVDAASETAEVQGPRSILTVPLTRIVAVNENYSTAAEDAAAAARLQAAVLRLGRILEDMA